MRAYREKHLVLVLIVLIFLGILFTNRAIVRDGKGEPGDFRMVPEGKATVFPLDINEADIDELVLLPGIGKVKAKAIVRYREENGGFSRIEDLVKVPGIGAKTLEKLKPYITVSKAPERDTTLERLKVNINEASIEELETLPGIGPVKARAIVEYRRKRGGFKKVEELLEVPGIGPKTLEKLRPYVEVGKH